MSSSLKALQISEPRRFVSQSALSSSLSAVVLQLLCSKPQLAHLFPNPSNPKPHRVYLQIDFHMIFTCFSHILKILLRSF